jgi:hypothetical protein
MNIITIDFETYYDRQFSLAKMTTEEYIRSDDFEVIGVGVKLNDLPTVWFSGSMEDIHDFLLEYPWHDSIAVAHNAMFDAAILTWVFQIKPVAWFDTLSAARAIDGIEVSGSLKACAERYGIGEKGTEVVAALGKRRVHFTKEELAQYGEYCKNDCELTFLLFLIYGEKVSEVEIKLIDMTVRMFSEPVLELDLPALENHLNSVRARKQELIQACEAEPEVLQSNPKFAELLRALGVDPPMKVSPANGKQTYAFAKNDEEFKTLLDHEDERVQAVVAARLGTKSTLEETRTERFIDIAKRGTLPVPLRYYAAHTGRWGGSDKLNLQNLPSRGNTTLKYCMTAPDGHVIVDCDSSQIEARVLAWLAGQADLVEQFAQGRDVYKYMASKIYNKPAEEITPEERFMGKTVVLGCGYGLGHVKFQSFLKAAGIELELSETKEIIEIYRDANDKIPKLWKAGQRALDAMIDGQVVVIGTQPQALYMDEEDGKMGFRLPSGYLLGYQDLQKNSDGEFSYKTRNGRTKIYGGKVVENVVQALARCVVGEQMVMISEQYRPILTVHDAVLIIAPEDDPDARAYVEKCMRTAPAWAKGLPVNCESKVGYRYGKK